MPTCVLRYCTNNSRNSSKSTGVSFHHYVNYSNIAARTLRRSLKSELKEEAAKRDQSFIKCLFWVNGEALPPGQKPTVEKTIEKITS